MEQPRGKRQKVTIACDPCRARKAKCDGSEPVCGPCRRRSGKSHTPCTWSASSRLQTSNRHVRHLQDRIAQLEGRGQPYDGLSSHSQAQDSSQLDSEGEIGPSNHQTLAIPDSGDAGLQLQSPGTAQVLDASPVYTVIGPTASEENSEGFFGSSSAGTFMQNVSLIVEQRLNGSSMSGMQFHSPPTHRDTPLPLRRSSASVLDQAEISLPLRKTADELMQVYWQIFHPTVPVLDRFETQETYERLWTGQEDILDLRHFLCLLNAVFAVASQLNPGTKPQDRAEVAVRYFRRSRGLLDIFQKGSVRTVQALLLLSVYCQSSSNTHECWIFMGLAIRIAQGLGLHIAQTSERIADPQTRDTVRRVWHACLLLDQIVSSLYGRPCGVGARNAGVVSLPTYSQDMEQKLTLDHFNHSVKLCRILHETVYSLCSPLVTQAQSLDELYDHYFGHDTSDTGKPSVLDIEKNLKRWRETIPGDLNLDSQSDGGDRSALQHRLAVTLQQNYLQVRLLLLRPLLSTVVSYEPASRSTANSIDFNTLPWRMSLQCAIACVRVAQEVISLIETYRPANIRDVGSLSSWWFNVLFLYTSATVLLASRLSPSITKEITETSILASWYLAVKLLDEYSAFGPPIKRLATTLKVLFDTVPKQRSQRQGKQKQRQKVRVQQPISEPHDTAAVVSSEERAVRWRLNSPVLPEAQSSNEGWGLPEAGQYFSFSPLPSGLLDITDDPFDLAWLTDLPAHFSF